MRRAWLLSLALLAPCLRLGSESERPLPAPSEQEWTGYYSRSRAAARAQTEALEKELAQRGASAALVPPKGSAAKLGGQEDEWYRSAEGRALTAAIISYQAPSGGWAKGIDLSRQRRIGEAFGPEPKYTATFDNGATTGQLRHLARARRATGDENAAAAFRRGLRFILAAQYPNGGWPQIYPLAGGYHELITYNDGAMVKVMQLLRDIARKETDFLWLEAAERIDAEKALQLALQCVFSTQIRHEDQLLAWAQQYEPRSLQPAPARAYEPIGLASAESAELLTFLLTLESPDAQALLAIESAARWLEETRIEGMVYDKASGRLISPTESGAIPAVWSRFYEIGTNRPLFGDRDGSTRYDLQSVSEERRIGYSWYVSSPAGALKRFARWRERRDERQ